MSSYRIIEVNQPRDIDRFIKLQYHLYRNDPNWVPPLIAERRKLLDFARNPFFGHADAKYFIVEKDSQAVGRIAAIINHRHNEFHAEKAGFFGFFDVAYDPEATSLLFQAAEDYLRQNNMHLVRGPANFSSNDDWGFLCEGFDRPPVFQMPYNPPYYLTFTENAGYRKCKDLLAYYIDGNMPLPERVVKVAELIKKRKNVLVRKVNLRRLDQDLEYVRYVYNNAWGKNWGFVPMTEEEIAHTASNFKAIVDPNIVFLAFVGDEPAGFSMTMPNINEVLQKMNGRLFPLGWLKFLWHLKIARSIKSVRVMAMGIVEKFRAIGLDTIFYVETFREGEKRGYQWAELSWILEDNQAMNDALVNIGAIPYKRYRLYEKPL